MLIVLPPSEGKTPPAEGSPVDPASLVHAGELGAKRERLLETLVRVASGNEKRALRALDLTPNQVGELELDRNLLTAPAGPAIGVYTGVLYERLAFTGLPAGSRARAAERLLIASALWGMLRPDDRIPAYRLSMKAKLPRIPSLAAWWRPALAKALAADDRPDRLVVDMRSAAYVAAWKPKNATRVGIRAFTGPASNRKAITHMAKAVRGEITAVLLETDEEPATPGDLASIIEAAGYTVETTAGTVDILFDDFYSG